MNILAGLLGRLPLLPLAEGEGGFWMPRQGSTVAGMVDNHLLIIFVVCLMFFIPIVALMIVFVLRYRKPPGTPAESTVSHNTAIEVVWTVVPTILVVFIFWIGLKGYLTLATPPGDAYTVDVEARQWSWSFYYPTAGVDSDELHVPPNVPIQLRMRSVDVLHAFFVPAFRVKNDIVPGKLSGLWFEATDPGRYQIFCAEYCGEKHSDMLSIVEVHPSREDFDEWLARAGSFPDAMPAAERGEILYKKKGCIQCHTLDGVESTGPTWKGLWIKEADRRQATRIPVLVDGDMKEIVRDEAYLEESMKNPAAKLARSKEGYVNRMSIIRLKPEEIIYLIEFIKSLGE